MVMLELMASICSNIFAVTGILSLKFSISLKFGPGASFLTKCQSLWKNTGWVLKLLECVVSGQIRVQIIKEFLYKFLKISE
jgi:hypothetical protein